ncbi:MAG TPA: hypothetical protein VH969_18320 [Actinophytocola sp.]
MPGRSGRLVTAVGVSGVSQTMNGRTSTTMTASARNSDPYQEWLSSTPPAIGPNGAAADTDAAPIANARLRWSAANIVVVMLTLAGSTVAAPSPMAIRATMKSCGPSPRTGCPAGEQEGDRHVRD